MSHHKTIQENIFTSKSNVLKSLATRIKKSKIESIYDFTITDWNNDKSEIVNDISKIFPDIILIYQ